MLSSCGCWQLAIDGELEETVQAMYKAKPELIVRAIPRGEKSNKAEKRRRSTSCRGPAEPTGPSDASTEPISTQAAADQRRRQGLETHSACKQEHVRTGRKHDAPELYCTIWAMRVLTYNFAFRG